MLAQITGMSDSAIFVNDQQMIKVNLHFDIPGYPSFDVQQSMTSSPTRMQIINAHHLVALVDPATQKYEIDWNASALIAGVVPAQFTSDQDGRTYDLRGQAGPLMQILQILRANGIPMDGTIDIRSNPVVRQQVLDIVRRAGAAQPAAAAPVPPPARRRRRTTDARAVHGAAAGADHGPATAGARDIARHGNHLRRRVQQEAAADPFRTLTVRTRCLWHRLWRRAVDWTIWAGSQREYAFLRTALVH